MPKKIPTLPLYKSVVIGADSYHIPPILGALATGTDVTRTWAKGHRFVSVELRGGGIVKSLSQFDRHNGHEDAFLSFMEECQRAGVARPSSYGDVFHEQYKSPRVAGTVNGYFENEFAGAWQEAIETGLFVQHLRKYDLNSAYLWAGIQGLPEIKSLSYSERIRKNGLYLVEIEPKRGAPFPFSRVSRVLVEGEDVELYGLNVTRVIGGATWRRTVSGQQILDTVQRFTFWKQIGRSYWGRWASARPIKCRTVDFFGKTNRQWELGNPFRNHLWAQVIVNRVKRRLYSSGVKTLHVFVDSVITPDTLPVNDEIGGWKLEADYPNGLKIDGPGWYGVPGQPPIKHAGSFSGNFPADVPASIVTADAIRKRERLESSLARLCEDPWALVLAAREALAEERMK
jgi:hypothetical protein